MHIGAQGHRVVHAAFHFLPQDLRGLFGLSFRGFHDQFIMDRQDQAAFIFSSRSRRQTRTMASLITSAAVP